MPKLYVNTTIKNDGFENLVENAVKGMQEATGLEFQIEKWKKLPKIGSHSQKNRRIHKYQKNIYTYLNQLKKKYKEHDELYTLDICDLFLFSRYHDKISIYQSYSNYDETHKSVIITNHNIPKEKHESLAYVLGFKQAGIWIVGKERCQKEECIFWDESFNFFRAYETDRKQVDKYLEKKQIIVCPEHKKVLGF